VLKQVSSPLNPDGLENSGDGNRSTITRKINKCLRRFGPPSIIVASFLILWQFVLPVGIVPGVPAKYLGTPSQVVSALLGLMRHGYGGHSLWINIGISAYRVLLGFGIGAVLATPLGLLVGRIELLDSAFSPIVSFLRPIPALAFIPVVTIWFGVGETSKIFVIAVTAFLFCFNGSLMGVRSVPKDLLLLADNLEMGAITKFRHVIFPPALPQILAGLRTGIAVSWAVLVAAELIGANRGLGYIISNAGSLFEINIVYVGIAIIGIIGVLFEFGFRALERRVLHWQGQ